MYWHTQSIHKIQAKVKNEKVFGIHFVLSLCDLPVPNTRACLVTVRPRDVKVIKLSCQSLIGGGTCCSYTCKVFSSCGHPGSQCVSSEQLGSLSHPNRIYALWKSFIHISFLTDVGEKWKYFISNSKAEPVLRGKRLNFKLKTNYILALVLDYLLIVWKMIIIFAVCL